jgi:outer membrane protein OmpA-like peptidoglycan-associated protein
VLAPDSALPSIISIANAIVANAPQVVTVTGYTDNVGTTSSNIALARQRAVAFARVLEAALSVRGGADVIIRIVAAGADDPVASNATASGQSRNRRVTVSWS